MWKIHPWCPHLRRRSRALQAGQHLAWVKDPSLWTVALLRAFCVQHGLGRFFYCFFFFHFLVSQCTYVSVCLCLQFSDRCRHICPTCVRKLGPLMMLLIRRKTVYKRCRMKCQAVCFKQRGCSMQIFNSPALQVDHEKVKKNSNTKIKKKEEKETLEFFYSSERNSSGLCMVAGTQWHQRNELTVVLSLSAWELSSKVQNLKKKSRKKDTMQQGRKAKKSKKKVLLQLRNKLIRSVHSCRCSVASHKWADCGTVIKSENLKKK